MRVVDVIAQIALGTVLLTGLIVFGNLQSVANGLNLGTQGNLVRTQLFSNAWSGLNLGSVAIIISAAVGIMALIVGSLTKASEAGLT